MAKGSPLFDCVNNTAESNRSVAALVSCYCFIVVSAVIVLGRGPLFLLFVFFVNPEGSSPIRRDFVRAVR